MWSDSSDPDDESNFGYSTVDYTTSSDDDYMTINRNGNNLLGYLQLDNYFYYIEGKDRKDHKIELLRCHGIIKLDQHEFHEIWFKTY